MKRYTDLIKIYAGVDKKNNILSFRIGSLSDNKNFWSVLFWNLYSYFTKEALFIMNNNNFKKNLENFKKEFIDMNN